MNDSNYNYADFSPHSYDFTNPTGLKVGDQLPSFELTNLEGGAVNLSNYAGKLLVLETGSMTCPLYVGKIKSMNALAQKFPNVQFLVIYIREAHPGKKIPSHDRFSSKANNAKILRQKEPENRTILIDSLTGGLHEKLGLLPNMAFVIGEDGTIKYRADWNIPTRINELLEAALEGTNIPTTPANFTPVAPHYSLRVLGRAGGLPAIWEFLSHLPQLIKQHKSHLKNRNQAEN